MIAAEVAVLQKLTMDPVRPYGVILGGAKVSDKIGVISNLLERVDVLAIGGGMLFTFLAAQGKEIGKSLVEMESIPTVKALLNRATELGVEILVPTDIVVAPAFANELASVVSADAIPVDQIGLDIGPVSSEKFAEVIKKCHTVFGMALWEFLNFPNLQQVLKQLHKRSQK